MRVSPFGIIKLKSFRMAWPGIETLSCEISSVFISLAVNMYILVVIPRHVTVTAFAVISDFNVRNKSSRENRFEFCDQSIRQIDVYYFSTFFTQKWRVALVRAVSSRLSVKIYRADKSTFYQGL